MKERIRQEWRTASESERVVKAAMGAWIVGLLLLFMLGGERLLTPPVLVVWFAGLIGLHAGAVVTIRRR
jgi:hypothetical protein